MLLYFTRPTLGPGCPCCPGVPFLPGRPCKIQTGLSTSPIKILSPTQLPEIQLPPPVLDSCLCCWEGKDPPRSRMSLLPSSSMLGTHWIKADLRSHTLGLYTMRHVDHQVPKVSDLHRCPVTTDSRSIPSGSGALGLQRKDRKRYDDPLRIPKACPKVEGLWCRLTPFQYPVRLWLTVCHIIAHQPPQARSWRAVGVGPGLIPSRTSEKLSISW